MGICNNCGKKTYLTHLHSCEMKTKKKWQGLTKDEIKSIYIDAGVVINFTDVVKLIEQKLKEKNHG